MTEPVRRSAAEPDRGTGGEAAGDASEDRRGRR